MSEITAPGDYPRRVLLAVTGLTPQIVTETLYALAVQGTASGRFVPTEIHVVTTREGARRVRDALLSPRTGAFHRLCSDYDLPSIRFDEKCIHVVGGAGGVALDDINSVEENTAAADCITRIVHELTSRRVDTAVHASIAGGRKTMGFYMGYAMSLLANPQDRLSHVLVAPAFESLPEFFYIPPVPQSLFDQRSGRNLDTRDAVITLAEIPFVRMRAGLPENVQQGKVRYSDVVVGAQDALKPPQLVIDLQERRVLCGGIEVPGVHEPALLALLRIYAERRQQQAVAPALAGYSQHDDFPADEYAEAIADLFKYGSDKAMATEQRIRRGDLRSKLQQAKSRINRELVACLGPERAAPYRIQELGESRSEAGTGSRAAGKTQTVYGLALRPSQISIIYPDDKGAA